MLTKEQIAEFNRNGCLIAGQVIPENEVQELRDELDRVINKGQSDGFAPSESQPVQISNLSRDKNQPVWQIVNIWEASPAFERLLYHPHITKALSQLTGKPDIFIWHDQIQYKPAHHGGINNWHQDAPYWPVLKPATPVTAWVALDDVDEDNGCMWMVPGSHKWGNHIKYLENNPLERFHELGNDFTPPDDAEVKVVKRTIWPVKIGHVSFHHSMTWHGSGKNVSDRPRRAIALHYMTGDARFVASGNHPMKKFIKLQDNAPMSQAGEHFPQVVKSGEPVGVPRKLKSAPAA